MKFDDRDNDRNIEEKPKKSWRDIDNSKDKKQPPREVVFSRGKSIEKTHAYKNYKSHLSKIFDGDVKTNISRNLEDNQSQKSDFKKTDNHHPLHKGRPQLPPREKLRLAKNYDDIKSAADECLAHPDHLPKDSDLLAKVLTLKDEKYAVQAIETLLELLERGKPKNSQLLIEKLTAACAIISDEHMRDMAKGIVTRLR